MWFSSQIYPSYTNTPYQTSYYPFYQEQNYQLFINQNPYQNYSLLDQSTPISFAQTAQVPLTNLIPMNYTTAYYLTDQNYINYYNQAYLNTEQDLNYQNNYQNYYYDSFIDNSSNLVAENNNINISKSVPLTMENMYDKNYLINSMNLNYNDENINSSCKMTKYDQDKNNIKDSNKLIYKKK